MRNTILGRRGLTWALAAVLAVSLPSTRLVWAADSPSSHLLSAQLPAGVALRHATLDQTCDAVHAAVAKRPEMATSIVQVAVLTKSDKYKPMDCMSIKRIVRAAMTAAPDKASEIVQMALSLAPDCADALNAVVNPNDPDSISGFNSPDDLYGGFGVGFGPGFPGSPGFTGSPPSGAIALPPIAVSGTTG